MNILCDQCVTRDVVNALRKAGFNTVHTSELGLSRSSDQEIFRYAQRAKRVLLSFDHGFGNITQFNIRNASGVVVVYIAEMKRQVIIERILFVFQQVLKQRQVVRHLFIVEMDSIRIWPK